MVLVHETDNAGKTMELVDIEGYRLPTFWKTAEEIKGIFENIPNFSCDDDSLMLCSYPKTGTNWIFEVISMIVRRKAERFKDMKGVTMLEKEPEENIKAFPMSPKVLNTHVNYKYLPKDLKRKQIKTILIVRNPKDTMVSFFNHHKGLEAYKYLGSWEDWLPMYLSGKLDYGPYDQYLMEWEEQIKNDPGFPLHILYYEDLKDFGVAEMKKLCKFLEIDLEEDLIQEILDLCDFKKMAKDKISAKLLSSGRLMNDFKFFRKGMIGDWKNWFTVAQNEMLDEIWNKKMETSMFKFRYEPSNNSK